MPQLSVVMIVKNEEHQLAGCLESLDGAADEVVIADTGSTDRTREVAQACGARIFEVPWTNDFSAARNAVVASAQGDWLLHLDADELLDPESVHTVRHLVDRDPQEVDAVEVLVANYCDDPRAWRWVPAGGRLLDGAHCSGYIPVPLLRLFRNGRGFVYQEAVHESITQSVLARGGAVLQRHDILIHHPGYSASAPLRQAKRDLYLQIAREKRRRHREDVKALHDLAEQALSCGFTEESEQACREALSRDPQHVPSVMTLANICLNRGEVAAGKELLERIEAHPEAPPHVQIGLSAIDYREGRLIQAMNRLERLLERHPDALLARLYLARVYDRFGAHDRSLRQLEVAKLTAPTVQEFQDRAEALKRRMDAQSYFQNGFQQEALETLISALRLDPEDPLIHNDLGVMLFTLGDHEKARQRFQQALKLAPGLTDAAENLKKLESAAPPG